MNRLVLGSMLLLAAAASHQSVKAEGRVWDSSRQDLNLPAKATTVYRTPREWVEHLERYGFDEPEARVGGLSTFE